MGSYAITASGAASQNYVFTYVNGTLTVTRAAPMAGYTEALSYVDDVTSEVAPEAEEESVTSRSSTLYLKNAGIRLPAGVQ